ncbi:HypC/HybG/HupF family hydrogenase formation chaperone [Stetteria hydrogenophila]
MCLGIPGKVVEVSEDGLAKVEFANGVVVDVDASTVGGVEVGDVVIVHAGIIISKIDEEEAKRLYSDVEEFIRDLEEKSEDFEGLLRRLGEVA